MANQLKMAEVQAIMALARSGWSHRHIARQLGVHRETVARLLRLSSPEDSKPASAPIGSEVLATGGSAGSASASEGAPIGSTSVPTGSASAAISLVSAAGPWREVILQ